MNEVGTIVALRGFLLCWMVAWFHPPRVVVMILFAMCMSIATAFFLAALVWAILEMR